MRLLVIILYQVAFLSFLISAGIDGDTTDQILALLGCLVCSLYGLDTEY